ncbi:hypothetical protein, partial [Legionella pneumophila]|uniref:hypothetical protein n=1 Tax=Legionella pneumophila TaxID=446 RepID=UPI00145B2099
AAAQLTLSLSLAAPIVSASWVFKVIALVSLTVIVTLGPSSSNFTLPPKSKDALAVAVSPSPSVVTAVAF